VNAEQSSESRPADSPAPFIIGGLVALLIAAASAWHWRRRPGGSRPPA
jgi:hypothetical protein